MSHKVKANGAMFHAYAVPTMSDVTDRISNWDDEAGGGAGPLIRVCSTQPNNFPELSVGWGTVQWEFTHESTYQPLKSPQECTHLSSNKTKDRHFLISVIYASSAFSCGQIKRTSGTAASNRTFQFQLWVSIPRPMPAFCPLAHALTALTQDKCKDSKAEQLLPQRVFSEGWWLVLP